MKSIGNRNKMKVLGFDGWTMGAHHYIRLLEAFSRENIELVLVHLGSWGEDKNRKKEENIKGLLVRDISFYKKSDFSEVLDFEQPDLVLFLSTETFAHRAFQRLCRHKEIPTIHLYHGLTSVTIFDGNKEPYKPNLLGQVKFVLRQGYKSFRHTFPVYARSLWKTSANYSEWLRFFKDIFSRVMGRTIFVPAADSVSTMCCVYTEADVQDAISRFEMSKREVVVVGNPDLLAFKMNSEVIGAMICSDTSKLINVMYIDTGFSTFGCNFESDLEYGQYVIELNNQLKRQQKQLLFKPKPHPPRYKEFISELLSKENIEIVRNDNFIDRLRTCCACITEPSTLGILPTLIGMPVFMVKCGPLKSLMYGSIFTTYPRAQYLNNIADFNRLLLDEQGVCNPSKVIDWINENSGPMPAEDMPKRVAQVVLDLIHTRSDASVCAANVECRAG